jgi:uncharacterized protein (DUF1697 family)
MIRRHVALLRGINVGKAKGIARTDLRALVESLGDGVTSRNWGTVQKLAAPARADP